MMEYVEKTLGKIIRDLAKSNPDGLAVDFADRDFKKTWKEFDEETTAVSKGLMAIGVNAGDKVSMWATNTPEWIVTLFATAKIGAVLVTVNTNYKTFELEYLLNQSDTKVLVLMKGFKDSDYVGITRELLGDEKGNSDGKISCKRLPVLERVIYSTPGEVPEDMLDFGKLKELGKAITDEEFEERFASVGVNDITCSTLRVRPVFRKG